MDHKLIVNGPQRPGKDPNLQPPKVARGRRGHLEFSKKVREIGVAPTPTDDLAKAAPKERGGNASEENVIGVFRNIAEGADTSGRAISLADLHAGRDPSTDPLPHEDANLQWDTDGPHHRQGEGADEGAMAK